ncbi:AIPR family protein [Rhodococcoides yunnanense]|uniref:AIPR family protein n=1 Tax=Rhodococcoides yunnanense TaxID=278209 RepID=UPI0009FC8417|nr:AIPR family protein [Rhodococcus yunnanensis]
MIAKKPGSSWRSAFDVIRADYNLSDDSIGVFALNLRFGLDDLLTVATESITGGGDDKKCDVLYVDKEREIAVLGQCYLSSKMRASAPANKASDLNAALSWLLTEDLDRLPEGLKGRADELRSAVEAGSIRQFHIWYVHNLPSSKNVRDELDVVEKTARNAFSSYKGGSEINIFAEEIGDSELEKLYAQAARTVIVTDQFQTTIPDAVELIQEDWKSIVTTVRGDWLHSLYSEHGTNLFSANLRGYLGSRESDSNINNGIKRTAQESPSDFYVFNNGITALVLDYEVGRRARGKRSLKITGISIVNGAQTTGSIGSLKDAPNPDLQVPIRFVKSDRESLIEGVVRYNNSQNRIQAADFRSTDQIQERLRIEFQAIPDAEYEGGRRGGSSDAIKRSKFTLPSYTVGQSLAAFHGDPVTAYDKKSDLWTNEKSYRLIFTDRTSARHIVFCYSLLNEINERKLSLEAKRKNVEAPQTSAEEKSLEFLNKKGSNYLLVHVIAQSMETILGKPIPNKVDLKFTDNISPAAGGVIWRPIIDMMLSLSQQLDTSFSRSRISNDSVARSVPLFIGLINSLSTLHRPTFEGFAKDVSID